MSLLNDKIITNDTKISDSQGMGREESNKEVDTKVRRSARIKKSLYDLKESIIASLRMSWDKEILQVKSICSWSDQ